MTEIQQHIASIRADIPAGVTLVCVSKFHSHEAIMEAYQCGERDFGESRVQELLPKHEALSKDIRWHFIGHLQTNKVKQVVPFVYMIHSVDSVRLLEIINKEGNIVKSAINEYLLVDLSKPENQKRWTIVYMHESPYTIIKQQNMAKFIDIFAEFGVDLVLCGHHHRYSRSHRMGSQDENGNDTIDNENGTYYVMCQATGIKLMGKTSPAPDSLAPWRARWDVVGNPMYIMWDITYDKIVMRPYSIANILPETANAFNKPELIRFNDELEITKPI